MEEPIQVVFEHLGHSDAIEARVREEASKLDRYYDRIRSVRAVIGRPQHRQHKGDTYSVRLQLSVPGADDIVISRDPAMTGRHEDVYVTIRDAFDAARRQLQDLTHKRQDRSTNHD